MKIIYMMHCEPLDSRGEYDDGRATFDKSQAIRDAQMEWAHLTAGEQKHYRVYVGAHTVDVDDDDPRSADQIYQDMLDDATWTGDCDVIDGKEG
jgi:hypothetical protein